MTILLKNLTLVNYLLINNTIGFDYKEKYPQYYLHRHQPQQIKKGTSYNGINGLTSSFNSLNRR